MTILAMIPARMGSQRLKQKNLQRLGGVPLITRAIRKCLQVPAFSEVYVNSEHPVFGEIAVQEGVRFHQRPPALADNEATSEQFVGEFLSVHPCDYVVQVHSIAPLLGPAEVAAFVERFVASGDDTYLSYVPEQIECAIGGVPINFTVDRKQNSQELEPVQRIVWSVTGWRRSTFLAAAERGETATYAGRVGFFAVSRPAGLIIKTSEDLAMAEALFTE